MTIRVTHKGDVIIIDFDHPKKGFATVGNHLTKKEYEMTNSSKGLKLLLEDVAEYFIEDLKDPFEKEPEDVSPDNSQPARITSPPKGYKHFEFLRCTRDLLMEGDGEVSFIKNGVYKLYIANDGSLFWAINEQNEGHYLTAQNMAEYFTTPLQH